MAGTFSQIHLHLVIAVKHRKNLIPKEKREEFFEYISGIIRNKGQKPIIVNGVGDHVHIFLGLKPDMKISDLARDIKNNSTNHFNRMNWSETKFSWQSGYGAFSYGESQVEAVFNYIKNQELHHKKKEFREEYMEILKRFNVNFEEKYLFSWDPDEIEV
ncbi:MAG: IS200/IS605 family transposase [Bacteroidota bacterium]